MTGPELLTRPATTRSGSTTRTPIGGFTYDKDIVVKVTASDPRAIMSQWFGRGWSMEYKTLDELDLLWYPRGVKELT